MGYKVKPTPTDLQNSAESTLTFVPTKGMLQWFEAAAELGHLARPTEISEKSGLDRTNWYQWLERPGFVEWWDAQWAKHLRVNRWKLDAIGMKKAEESYDYWHSMMERTGNIEPQTQAGPTTAVQINLGDEQLKRIIED